ncbi:MAG TPA: FAD-dependent oxidoreductase [Sphingomicrobium sp.]
MRETADVVIIGAGIIGLNIAFQIVRRSALKVIVLEKGVGLGEGSTGASSAVCRHRYSRAEMVALARDGIDAYRNWQDYLGLSEPRARFHNHGVLWLAGGDSMEPTGEQQRLAGFGVRSEVLDDAELQRRFPAMNPCILPPDTLSGSNHECRGGGNHLLETDGGYIDPVDALQDVADALRARHVTVRMNTEVSGILQSAGAATGVALAGGERIDAPVVVNAAGPWCNHLYADLGLDIGWPLEPTRIQVVHIDRPPALTGDIPVTVDPAAGIYFRLQNRGQQIIVSTVREEDEEERVDRPDDFARYVDADFERAKLHALQHRLPALTIRNVRGYSGLYTVNRSDVHPIVGETAIKGLYAANGCSGHGFKLAPALGALLARQFVGPASSFDTGIDPAFLAVGRDPIRLKAKNVLA